MARVSKTYELTIGEILTAVCAHYRIKREDIWRVKHGCQTFYGGNSDDMRKDVTIDTYNHQLQTRKRRGPTKPRVSE